MDNVMSRPCRNVPGAFAEVIDCNDRFSLVLRLSDDVVKPVSEYWKDGDEQVARLAAQDACDELAETWAPRA